MMIIKRLFDCSDFIFKEIGIDTFFDCNNKIKDIKVWYKKKNATDWNVCKVSSYLNKSEYVKIELDTSYCEELHVSHKKNGGSFIKIQNKWLPLRLISEQAIETQKNILQTQIKSKIAKPDIKKTTVFPNIKTVVNPNVLTKNSPFHEVTQYLAKKYYLQAYPGDNTTNAIKRYKHGATHVSCATLTADNLLVNSGKLKHVENNSYNGGLFIELLKAFLPQDYINILHRLNYGNPLTEEDFLLTKYALFCHDIANTSECFSDEKAHAAIFKKEMLRLGFDEKSVNKFAFSMANKDAKEKENIFQMIIHDGDCLEINRVLSDKSHFDVEELEIVKLLRKYSTTSKELDHALSYIKILGHFYFELMQYIYGNTLVHQKCELSANCYLEVSKIIKEFSISRKIGNLNQFISSSSLGPLEIYFDHLSATVVQSLKATLSIKSNQKENTLELFKNKGLYLRVIRDVESELAVLTKNSKVLNDSKITQSMQLKKFFANDGELQKNSLLTGFNFRPATFVKAEFKIDTISQTLGLIINPYSASTLSTHFYKHNVGSNCISAHYSFKRPCGAKELGSLPNLVHKLREHEQRRRGECWDNYNRCYGTLALEHNEVLMTYNPESILGVFISSYNKSKLALQYKLSLENVLNKEIPIYAYLAGFNKFRIIGVDEMLIRAGIKEVDIKYNSCFDPSLLNEALQEMKLSQPTIGDQYEKIEPSSLESIGCSVEKNSPSTQSPIKYFFTYSKAKITQGEAYVDEGVPILKINSIKIYDRNLCLFKIAEEYQKRLVKQCNDMLQRKEIQHAFSVSNIKLELLQSKNNYKTYLNLTYYPLKSLGPEFILNGIGYLPSTWKWEKTKEHASGEVEIRLSVVQSVDAIYNKLKGSNARSLVVF